MIKTSLALLSLLFGFSQSIQLKGTSKDTQAVAAHTCIDAITNWNAPQIDWQSVINAGVANWVDTSFPTNDAIYWKNTTFPFLGATSFNGGSLTSYAPLISWKRARAVYGATTSLVGAVADP